MKAPRHRPDDPCGDIATGPGTPGRFGARAVPNADAAHPRWLKLGIAAALGFVAGTMLFPTGAQGRGEARRPGG